MFSIGVYSIDSLLSFGDTKVRVCFSIFCISIMKMLRIKAAFRAAIIAPPIRLKILSAMARTNFSVAVATRCTTITTKIKIRTKDMIRSMSVFQSKNFEIHPKTSSENSTANQIPRINDTMDASSTKKPFMNPLIPAAQRITINTISSEFNIFYFS